MLNLVIVIIASYLLGSFPTGIIAGRLLRGVDIRAYGSGNTGATNSLRVLGWKVGSIVALVDMAKGWVAVAVITRIALFQAAPVPESLLFITAALAAVLGHIKPVFAGFRGGKGFGTAAGAISAAYPVLAPFCLGLFAVTLTLTGYVAVCAAVTAGGLPFFYLLATRYLGVTWDPVILVFFICTFFLTVLGVRKKLGLYLSGQAELFEKVMILKPRKTSS